MKSGCEIGMKYYNFDSKPYDIKGISAFINESQAFIKSFSGTKEEQNKINMIHNLFN